jgi:hypothetical protein
LIDDDDDDTVVGCAAVGVDGFMSGMHEKEGGEGKEDENGKEKKGDAALGGDGRSER